MFPRRPILWFVLFVITFFTINYFIIGSARTILTELIYTVVVGACALGALYIGEKIRKKWFTSNDVHS